ncbi:MAG: toll/interleukin-1 receptor domain-containing protein [Methylacidiphilales bacterium]|nr:toll/interleukin-1 receptor domain-containing protein [Candidatus Methylacidiphilales bacterium]
MATDVFISHSSTDKEMADTICAFLESKNIPCWIAPRNILPGEEWGDSILRGINTCRVMVLIFSKAANDSGPVRSEVDRAVNARKILIPFRIENVQPTGAMEFHIGRRHWLDAYTPPLERHLELLVRAVHDILNPAPAATDLPPVTLSSDGTAKPSTDSTARRPGPPMLPRVTQDEVPLRVLLNFNHVVVAGHPSTFQIMVENTGARVLKQIQIVMESRGLEQPVRKNLAKLDASQSQRHLFEIEPIRSGNFALQCTIKCHEQDKQIALVGSRSLRINETPETSNVAINMKDLKGNAAGGETAAAGESPLGNVVPSGTIRTLNDLLNLELAENFEPLELTLDYEVDLHALAQEEAGARQRLQIPGAFLDQAQQGTLLKLEPIDTSAHANNREIRLVARSSFCIGRSREEADFLTWFWPRNEANDQKTRRISKKHCIFSIHGVKIHIRDNETSNRTTLGGQELAAKDGEPLERRGILKIAGIYVLDVTPFPSNAPEGPVIANLRNWSGAKTETPSKIRGSVRFLPMTSHVLPQNSTWLLTDGAFGTSRANPIIIDARGLAEIQGRFHHHLGGFWIESSVNNGAVHINGARLEPGFIVPLLAGQTVKLGETSFRVIIVA